MSQGKDENGNPPLTDFPLHQKTITALLGRGITHLFPIQAMTFETIFKGKDVIGRARTGCGKTLAFALPIIERLRSDERVQEKARGRAPACLVLAPTRTCPSVAKSSTVSPSLSHVHLRRGVVRPQKSALWKGVTSSLERLGESLTT